MDCFLTCYLLNVLNQSPVSWRPKIYIYICNNRLLWTLKWKSCQRQLEKIAMVALPYPAQVRVLLYGKSSPNPDAKRSPNPFNNAQITFLPSFPPPLWELSLSTPTCVHGVLCIRDPQITGIVLVNIVYLRWWWEDSFRGYVFMC